MQKRRSRSPALDRLKQKIDRLEPHPIRCMVDSYSIDIERVKHRAIRLEAGEYRVAVFLDNLHFIRERMMRSGGFVPGDVDLVTLRSLEPDDLVAALIPLVVDAVNRVIGTTSSNEGVVSGSSLETIRLRSTGYVKIAIHPG